MASNVTWRKLYESNTNTVQSHFIELNQNVYFI